MIQATTTTTKVTYKFSVDVASTSFVDVTFEFEANVTVLFDITVDVRDDDAPRVLITETDGGTKVIEGQPADTYSVRLVKAPAADVTVLLFSDGQTNLEGDRVEYVDVRPPLIASVVTIL